MPGRINTCDLLESAPRQAERVAPWLLSLGPFECEAVFPAVVVEAVLDHGPLSPSMLNAWLVAVQAQARRLRGDKWSYQRAVELYGSEAGAARVPVKPMRWAHGGRGKPRSPAQTASGRRAVVTRCLELLETRATVVVREHFTTPNEYEALRKAVARDDRLRWLAGRPGGDPPARVVRSGRQNPSSSARKGRADDKQ